jgi:hypothetical protein
MSDAETDPEQHPERSQPDHEHPEQEHPEQEAHGGSMAPGLVDDVGRPTGDVPPTTD